MFQCFYPSKMEESSYVIPYENWKKMGIQGIVYDIDNTLVPHGAPADERAIRLFEHLRGLGLKTCLLSNNKEPRVKSFAQQVKCPYIYKGGKPGAKGYKKAMETMGTDVKNTLFVGDQLFTDIWGANRLGIQTVLVRPINPKEEKRDLALVMNKDITCGQVEECIYQACSFVKDVTLFDVYEGQQIAEDKKSMAFTVLFTPKEETFQADTVDGYVKKILKQLKKAYEIELRS